MTGILSLVTLTFLSFSIECSTAFTTPHHQLWSLPSNKISKSKLNLDFFGGPSDIPAAAGGARGEFFLCFFGSSGGAGIALGQLPTLYKNAQAVKALKGQGPTKGGDMLKISPICGYPEDVSVADYQQIINNPKSLTQLQEQGPKDGSYMVECGYLSYQAFCAGNPKCNPLALRAVFDTLGASTNIVSPVSAQEIFDKFKADQSGDEFKNALLFSKLRSLSAIFTLIFLIGTAEFVALNAASRGWFPDWPGLENLPVSLINPGFWTIKDYWI